MISSRSNRIVDNVSSTWTRTAGKETISYPSLSENISSDVGIIGGGLAGVTAAYLLAKAGKKVSLVTSGTSESTTTAHTTGFLTIDIDTSFPDLIEMFGEERAIEVWKSGHHAIRCIEEITNREKIDCEFSRCSLFTVAHNKRHWQKLKEEAALIRKYAFPIEARCDALLPLKNNGYWEMKDQGKFHALKYLRALKKKATEAGAKIFDNTEALKIEENSGRRLVRTKTGTMNVADVLIATYYPFTRPRELFAHTGRYITYIIEMPIPKRTFPEALFQDTKNPYHYLRVDHGEKEDRLIFGGEDHRAEVPIREESNYRALQEHVRAMCSLDLTGKITTKWKWSILEPLDGLPYIGPLMEDPHQYVITGLSGTGLTMSTLGALIVSDAILGQKNKWSTLYSLGRTPTPKQLLYKGKDYLSEFFGGVVKNLLRKN